MIVWSKETIEQFRKDYPVMTNAALSRKYGITTSQVRTQARKLQLEKAVSRKQVLWDGVMLETFIRRYRHCRTSVVAREMGISTKTAQRKARELGLTKDTELEERKVKRERVADLYGLISNRKIARQLHISKDTVSAWAAEMGLTLSKEEQDRRKSETLSHALWYEDYCRTNLLSHTMVRVLGYDKKRKNMEYRLAADGYLVWGHCDKVYYTASMRRHPIREKHAEKMGFVFIEYPQTEEEDNEGAFAPENSINSSSMIIKGKITEASPVREIKGQNGKIWNVQNFLLETDDERPQHCVFEVFGDNIAKFNIQKDEHLAVDITMSANKGRSGDWFSHNRAVSVTRE